MTKQTTVKISPYPDRGGRWRWRMRRGNNQVFAVSGESYSHKGNALRAARTMAALIPGAVVVDD